MPNATSLIPINNFFSDVDIKSFEIPIYQRKYSWDKDQLKDFISDFDNLYHSTRPDKYHFFGLVVICETARNSKKFEIIDGQQRITTISLFISILRDLIQDIIEHPTISSNIIVKEELDDLKVKLNGCLMESRNPKLSTKNEAKYEAEFLNIIMGKVIDLGPNYISQYNSQPNTEKSTFELKSKAMTETPRFNQTIAKHKPLRKNYELLHKEITQTYLNTNIDAKPPILQRISSIILEEFKLIPFHACDQREAFALFETLNDRGLDVAAVDLIKNLCLKQGANQIQRDSIFQIWKNIFTEQLTGLDGIVFLRYSYNSRFNFITKSELYKSYSEIITPLLPAELDNFLNELLDDARIYKLLHFEDNSISLKFTNVLRLLRSTGTNQYITLTMAVFRCLDTHINSPQFQSLELVSLDLLTKLHKLILSILINGQGMNQIERLIPSLAKKIICKDPIQHIIDVHTNCIEEVSNATLHVDSSKLDQLILDNNYLSLCLLTTVLYHTLPHSNSLPTQLTLEHVFPVSPKDFPANWPEIHALSTEQIQYCLYSIGNHLPINQALNSSVSNRSFSDKKNIYQNKNVKDLDLNKPNLNLFTIQNWTFEVIEDRKKLINDRIIEYFNL